MTIKFRCSVCGCKRLREFSKNVTVSFECNTIQEYPSDSPEIEYSAKSENKLFSHDFTDTWYACDQCETPIKNETGDLLHCAADLLDWLNERNMVK